MYPFYPGISVRNYTDERLAELDARNVPYGGGLYTRYEITQMQRALERKVRRYKRRYLAETAAGVDASRSTAKLKAARQQLSAFLNETGERLDGARAEVPGFGQREAKQADATAERYTNPAASGILDTSNRIGVNPDVNYICDLNPEIYKAAVPTITTEHVIITDKQLEHQKLQIYKFKCSCSQNVVSSTYNKKRGECITHPTALFLVHHQWAR